jgi:hypothetical protein
MIDAMHHPLSQINILHRLRNVGFSEKQAEEQAQIITEVHETNLGTKQVIKALEIKNDSEFVLLKTEINSRFDLLDMKIEKEILGVKKDIESLKVDLTLRIGAILGLLLTLFGIAQKLLIN